MENNEEFTYINRKNEVTITSLIRLHVNKKALFLGCGMYS